MELIFGFIMCGVVSLGVHVYLRLFAVEGARHLPFEAWSGEDPLILAVHCLPGRCRDVHEALRHELQPHAWFSNSQGRYPWQHYVVRVDLRHREEDEVVLLHVTGSRQPRLREKHADLMQCVESALKPVAPAIEEVWLHGHLHRRASHAAVEQARIGWLGAFEEDGTFQLDAMIGRPPWLPQSGRAAA